MEATCRYMPRVCLHTPPKNRDIPRAVKRTVFAFAYVRIASQIAVREYIVKEHGVILSPVFVLLLSLQTLTF